LVTHVTGSATLRIVRQRGVSVTELQLHPGTERLPSDPSDLGVAL
jgi:hypothetical protein